MYAKISGAKVLKFPYTFGDLRKDNPNVSFPKNIDTSIMNRYNMVGIIEGPQPAPSAYQRVQRNALPARPVLGQDDDGNDMLAGYWQIDYTAVDIFADTTEDGVTTTKSQHEAAYQAGLDAKTAEGHRTTRNKLLADTDWTQMNDSPLSNENKTAWSTYRQELRDISDLDAWPNLTDDDWPVEP